MPDVTGDTLQLADSTLKDAGLVPQHVAFFDSSSPGSTNVVRTSPAANTAVSTGSHVQVFVPIQHYDMIAAATQAKWTATSQVTSPSATVSAGTQTGTAGQVFVLMPATLEDNSVASPALVTVPPPVQGYTISGRYELGGPGMEQEIFRADLGFRQGTPAGESIRFQVVAIANGSSTVVDSGLHDSGSGQVVHVKGLLPVDTTAVVLNVTVLDATTTPDQILWAAPLIEESNASPPPERPKASVSPPTPTGT